MTSPVAWAIAYAQSGFSVFPCRRSAEKDKQPLISGWREAATTDEKQIHLWATQFPDCRWGVECEKSGLFIVDADTPKTPGAQSGLDSLALLQAEHEPLPPTWTVKTKSGGRHLYFIGAGKNAANNLGKRLDTRSVGGYVVIPDDIDYVVLDRTPPAPAPLWLIDLAGKPLTKEQAEHHDVPAPGVELDRMDRVAQAILHAQTVAPGAEPGERDVTAYAVACQLRDFGLTYQTTARIMAEVWANRPDVHLGPDFDLGHVEWKVNQAYKTAQNRLGANLPEAVFTPIVPEGPTQMQSYGNWDFDPRRIPPREWVLGTWMLRRFLTVTVAPGGVGKSGLSLVEALAVITGRNLSGDHIHRTGNVWMHNGEDPLEEIWRRVAAACICHNVPQHTLTGRLLCTSGRIAPITLVREVNHRPVVDYEAVAGVKKFIADNNILLWVIDPFIDAHDCDENDNPAINRVAKTLSQIAEETGCSIHVVHHTRKKGRDGATNDMDMGRGASALLSAARIGRNLGGMSAQDAKDLQLTKPPAWYVRLDSSKANLAPPAVAASWFERVDVPLPNGDGVGTLRPVDLVPNMAEINAKILAAALEYLDAAGTGAMCRLNQVAAQVAEDLEMKRTTVSAQLKRAFAHPYFPAHNPDNVQYQIFDTGTQARPKLELARVPCDTRGR